MRLHAGLKNKIFREKAVTRENNRKRSLVKGIDQSVQSREEGFRALGNRRLTMLIKGILKKIHNHQCRLHFNPFIRTTPSCMQFTLSVFLFPGRLYQQVPGEHNPTTTSKQSIARKARSYRKRK